MSTYLDHNATSPLHAEVLEAMLPFLKEPVANASSLHAPGRMARSAIEQARSKVADLLGCQPSWIIFTSGATESNNFLLKGFVDPEAGRPVVSSEIEHPSVAETVQQLEQQGQEVEWLPSNDLGQVDLDRAKEILQHSNPQILSVIAANSETGVIQPVRELSEMVNRSECLVHSDMTQVAGKLSIDMAALNVDAASISAHKLMGPQGIGALAVNRKPLRELISGGGQEKNRRSGTENVPMIVGFGRAAELALLEIEARYHHLLSLRDRFEKGIKQISNAVIFGEQADRLPNTCYFAIPWFHGESLLMELDKSGFALASGSACHSEVTKPSHVLTAMGVDDSLALNAVRVSFGMSNSTQDVDAVLTRIHQLVDSLPLAMRRAASM